MPAATARFCDPADEAITMCCHGLAVGKGARMEILRRGLDVLAAHYG